jgi:integrase
MQKEYSQATPRRTRVAKHPGIYYRDTSTGRRYEVTYLDSDGCRRWKTVDGGLRDAEAELRAVGVRKDRGERVSASKATVAEVAAAWLDAQTTLRPRTREKYDAAMRLYVIRRFGRRRIASITEDDVADLIGQMQAAGKAAWTIRGVLVPLSRLFAYAARRGIVGANPVARLERGERPKVGKREKRILKSDEIASLLDNALPTYRALLATAVYTGLRQSELLGLVWRDVDFEAGVIHVCRQLDRNREHAEPKTPQAVRAVVLAPAVARLLRQHRIARPTQFSGDDDPVFSNETGRPFSHRYVQSRGFDKASERAGINPPRKPKKLSRESEALDTDAASPTRRRATFHDLRHTFASLLIAGGADVVHVSRQLGHADPAITLRVYADEFAAADHAERTRALLDAAVGNTLEPRVATNGKRLRRGWPS